MPRNKPRLQLALYARPKHPGSYHYALLTSPKSTPKQQTNPATKHHVKNTLLPQTISGELPTQPWRYERLAISNIQLEQRLLVRIVIAKVTSSLDALERILETVPVYQTDDLDQVKAQSFNCLAWVRAALDELRVARGGVVDGLGEWEEIQAKAVEYVERKKEVGRWRGVGVPMLDLLDGREVVG
ncbi:hypothetical protein DM02DRAFT_588347 [Periconia macrospinosa]|uniref:Uncharacterized protein n=1 Tax=Periconia macrospinosa TaxID=97972 RepID=A0A2V1DYF1_9PLEO|nr:hypothetical protein DM02DRAFT_588347 [Periconia macrospinosa]